MQMRQQLIRKSTKTYGGKNGRRFITVHETANRSTGAGAAAHANLQSRGNVRNASWHWQVDDHEAVQSFDHEAQCWHAGDGRGPGNLDSIAVEICVNEDGNYPRAIANAAELVRHIMATESIPAERVVDHHYWSGKNCPTQLRGGRLGPTWAAFLDALGAPTPAPPTAHLAPQLDQDGIRGRATIGGWQQIMGTPVDEKISTPTSLLIKADQQWLNQALGEGHIRNLTGKGHLAEDGREGPLTVICRAFLLHNRTDPSLTVSGVLTRHHIKAHQAALNAATIGSAQY